MERLNEPSIEIVKKVLSEVDFKDRVTGYKLSERLGPTGIALYSFEEITGFLSGKMRYLDIKNLEKWVREIVGDFELAERIKQIEGEDLSLGEKLDRITKLMATRLLQCRKKVKGRKEK